MVMTDFSPKNGSYNIYYPKHFILLEDEEGIVTFTDSISGFNITVSEYALKKKLSNDQLIELLNTFLKAEFQKEFKKIDWFLFDSQFDNLVEIRFNKNNTYWAWWGASDKKRLVVISINKDTEISEEEIRLVQYMINGLEIHK